MSSAWRLRFNRDLTSEVLAIARAYAEKHVAGYHQCEGIYEPARRTIWSTRRARHAGQGPDLEPTPSRRPRTGQRPQGVGSSGAGGSSELVGRTGRNGCVGLSRRWRRSRAPSTAGITVRSMATPSSSTTSTTSPSAVRGRAPISPS